MTDSPKPDLFDQLQFTEAEAETERIISEETEKERRAFKPHIHADFSFVGPCRKRPDLSRDGGSKIPKISIPPDISNLASQQQLPLLKPLIEQHYSLFGNHITEYGEKIDGYRAWLSLEDWDECEFYLFDTDGEHIPDDPAPWPRPRHKRIKPSNRGSHRKSRDIYARRNGS